MLWKYEGSVVLLWEGGEGRGFMEFGGNVELRELGERRLTSGGEGRVFEQGQA